MLESINSDHTAVENIDTFGIDPEAAPFLLDSDYQVNLDPPSPQATVEEMELWPDPLQDDGLQGVELYKKCLGLVGGEQ